MTPTERLLEQIAKLLEETADVLKRTERLLSRALAVRDGIAPDPVQRCALERYNDKHEPIVCDLEINHRGNHATGGVFWRLGQYGGSALCAAQEPGETGPKHVRRCSKPALHEEKHHNFSDEEGRHGW